MTLDEKIGQLAQYTGGSTITGPTGEKLDFDAMIAKGEIGSLFNVVGAKETDHYQHIAVEQSRLHIPLLFGLDVIHGHRTTFPVPLALAASFDPDIVQQASPHGGHGSAAGRRATGSSRRWWTSRAMRAGAALSRAQAKIRTWAARSRARISAAISRAICRSRTRWRLR